MLIHVSRPVIQPDSLCPITTAQSIFILVFSKTDASVQFLAKSNPGNPARTLVDLEDDYDNDWRTIDEGDKLKSTGTTYWNAPNSASNNETGFTALPAGDRWENEGLFNSMYQELK